MMEGSNLLSYMHLHIFKISTGKEITIRKQKAVVLFGV